MKFSAQNPFNLQILGEYNLLNQTTLDAKIQGSHESFRNWRFSTVEKRLECLVQLSALLRERRERLAQTVSLEMGKLISEALAEIDKCASLCDYYVENAERFLRTRYIKTTAKQSSIHYQPLGPILGVMPWNFPYWQVFRFAIPAITMGNTILLKHALNVPQCALDIEAIFAQAGYIEGVYQNLFIDNETTTALLGDSRIAAASLTGSERAGASVAANAGRHLKKTVLELGGSDPFIVLEDVNIDEVVKQAIVARFQNCGQSCIAAKRFIVQKNIAELFINAFINKIQALKPGNPLDPETTLAPMARLDLRENLERQVNASIKMGAKILTGGNILNLPGVFYAPSVLTEVPESSPAYYEELFGPVASFFVVNSLEDVVRVANDTSYGLGSSIWTQDLDKAQWLSQELQAGMVFINSVVKSQPALPFGGIKRSGYGRELSEQGLHEFANCKTVYVDSKDSCLHS